MKDHIEKTIREFRRTYESVSPSIRLRLCDLDPERFPAITERINEIKSQLALGTLDVNKMCGADFLAIGNPLLDSGAYDIFMAIKDLWIENKRNSYIGKEGFEALYRSSCVMNLDTEIREQQIRKQNKINHDAKNDPLEILKGKSCV